MSEWIMESTYFEFHIRQVIKILLRNSIVFGWTNFKLVQFVQERIGTGLVPAYYKSFVSNNQIQLSLVRSN